MGYNILYVIATVSPAYGGPVEGVLQMSLINRELGHHIEIASLDSPGEEWLADFPFPVHPLGPGRTHYAYSPRLVPWLRQHVNRFDAVIINGIWSYNCFGAWRVLCKTKIPYFVYLHGMLDPWFKRTFPLKHLKKWLFWPWAVYPALRDANAVLFTCDEERRLARESFWLYRCNEVVVSYGTPGAPEPGRDYATAFLEKHPVLRNVRRFVFLGRVHPKKGPDILIRAFARVLAAHDPTFRATPVPPHSLPFTSPLPFVLIMAGPADGAYAVELKSLASTLGVADRVYWTGMVRGEGKWGALQCAEAFLLPSHQENFGIAVVEALSVGVPVLISKAVNIWKEIGDANAGITEEDSVDGCERQIVAWLMTDDERKDCMRKNARNLFEARYTSRRAAQSLIEEIGRAIATV